MRQRERHCPCPRRPSRRVQPRGRPRHLHLGSWASLTPPGVRSEWLKTTGPAALLRLLGCRCHIRRVPRCSTTRPQPRPTSAPASRSSRSIDVRRPLLGCTLPRLFDDAATTSTAHIAASQPRLPSFWPYMDHHYVIRCASIWTTCQTFSAIASSGTGDGMYDAIARRRNWARAAARCRMGVRMRSLSASSRTDGRGLNEETHIRLRAHSVSTTRPHTLSA
jgi:hypothetical protein